jgi:MFS family permease
MSLPRKYFVLASLYIVQSVPLAFLKTGFQTFLRDENISYDSISSLMGLLLMPWVFKFLWAPAVDRWCANKLPKIRTFILVFQVAGALLLGITAIMQFPDSLQAITAIFFIFSLVAATQDIVVDSLAVLTLPKKEHGLGNTFQIGGYYLGEVLGGALILIIFDQFGWNWAMAAFVIFFLIPFIPVLFYKAQAKTVIPPPSEKGFANLKTFFSLKGMNIWLVVMVVYMGNQVLSRTLLPSLFTDMGYSKTEIASIVGVWGNTASVLGAVIGGVLVNKWGRKNSLVIFGAMKVIALLGFFFIHTDATDTTVYSVIMVNDFISGLATVTVFTIMMDKCRLTSPGTDFTIQQSVNQFAILFFVIISGIVVKLRNDDFTLLFIIALIVGVIGVLLASFGLKKENLDNGNGFVVQTEK